MYIIKFKPPAHFEIVQFCTVHNQQFCISFKIPESKTLGNSQNIGLLIGQIFFILNDTSFFKNVIVRNKIFLFNTRIIIYNLNLSYHKKKKKSKIVFFIINTLKIMAKIYFMIEYTVKLTAHTS